MLEKINPKDLNPMHRKLNETAMVGYINRHSRWSLDVRKSFVYYDADKDFVAATNDELADTEANREVIEALKIKFYSKGC